MIARVRGTVTIPTTVTPVCQVQGYNNENDSVGTAFAYTWNAGQQRFDGSCAHRFYDVTIIIGPGSFYTSLMPNFLVHGVPEAMAQIHIAQSLYPSSSYVQAIARLIAQRLQ